MKWLFDPKGLAIRLLVLWLMLLAAWILLYMAVLWLIRNWYWVLLVVAIVIAIRLLLRWLRRRLDRW